MNEHIDFERLVAGHIADEGVTPPSDAFYDELFTRAGGSGQRPEWLALIKEPPMRTNNHLAVGSPTVRLAAILAATMLLAVALAAAGAGVQRLQAAGPIVVAQDGSGHHTTIQAAIDVAANGDDILVRPGTYIEAVIIHADIELRGDGPREEIVVQAPGELQPNDFTVSPFALALIGSDASVSGLTLFGRGSRVHVEGGAPLLDDLALDSVGDVYTGSNSDALDSIGFHDGSTAVFSNSNVFAGGSVAVHDMAEPQITGNTLDGGTNVYLDSFGPATRFENNTIVDSAHRAIGIWSAGPMTIADNTIEDAGAEAISVNAASPVLIEGNTIVGGGNGIVVPIGANATVIGNRIAAGRTAISWSSQEGVIQDNEITGGGAGISIVGDPVVSGNTVEGVDGPGIVIGFGASPILSGNTSCGNAENYVVADGATPVDDGSNDFCEDAAAK